MNEQPWIEHDGSGVPEVIKRLPPDARVENIERGGRCVINSAGCLKGLALGWMETGLPFQIVSYRILDQAAAQGQVDKPRESPSLSVDKNAIPPTIDPNARMLENDFNGANAQADARSGNVQAPAAIAQAEQVQVESNRASSHNGCPLTRETGKPEISTGRPTYPGLLMVADPDRRGALWGAME